MLGDGTITHNTTIAKIIGEMYKNMDILSRDGVFRIATREDFIAGYLGQTAIKTRELLDSCLGGVLFIDEVYSLGPESEDKDSFSKECVDVLTCFLSENCNTFCCIIAGYEEDIKRSFFSRNKGLERRFQWVHKIEKYDMSELNQIFFKKLSEIRWTTSMTPSQFEHILASNSNLFSSAGGDIENLLTKSKMCYGKRTLCYKLTVATNFVLTYEDIVCGIRLMKENRLTDHSSDANENRDSYMMMYT
jgi:hypothetical protein